MKQSLQLRLGIGLMLSLVVLLVVQWAVVSLAIRTVVEGNLAARLEHDAENLLGALTITGTVVDLDPKRVGSQYQRPFSGHYFQIQVGDLLVRSRSLWDQVLDTPHPAVGDQAQVFMSGPEGQRLMVRSATYRKQGQVITVAVAEDLSGERNKIHYFRVIYAVFSLGMLGLLILVQQAIVRSSLRPLNEARRSVSRLERGEISQLGEGVPTEVRPLVREVNRLLRVLAERLERSRKAVGNLAHAIKTPLMKLRQLAGDPVLQAQPQLAAQLEGIVAHLNALVERELKRARLAGATSPGARFLVEAELPGLLDALRQIYRERGLEIEWSAEGELSTPFDREDMLELLGNLLDNACKWAAHRVRVQVEGGEELLLAVEDDGPGCPEEELSRLGERGVRLDESVAGHGLGLGIASDIVHHYGGHLELGRSQALGGFSATVRLPLQRD